MRSKAQRSFKNSPSTCPPKTKNFDPTIATACPYLPAGAGPVTPNVLHSRDTVNKMRTKHKGEELEWGHTQIQEIQSVILLFIWSRIWVGIGISTPDNDNISHEGAGMAHSRTWGYAGGLDKTGGIVVGVKHVDIVPGCFSDKTTEDVEFTGWSSGCRKRMAVSWKWRRGRGSRGSDTRSVDDGGRKKNYASSSPRK